MSYTDKVIEHFKNPHNQGVIDNADAIGQEGNPVCGDVMKIYLRISGGDRGLKEAQEGGSEAVAGEKIIDDIKFETLGCAAAIAVSSMLTDIAKGKTLDEAMGITKDDVVRELGGLPDAKIHCSMLGVDALHQAIEKYRHKHN